MRGTLVLGGWHQQQWDGHTLTNCGFCSALFRNLSCGFLLDVRLAVWSS